MISPGFFYSSEMEESQVWPFALGKKPFFGRNKWAPRNVSVGTMESLPYEVIQYLHAVDSNGSRKLTWLVSLLVPTSARAAWLSQVTGSRPAVCWSAVSLPDHHPESITACLPSPRVCLYVPHCPSFLMPLYNASWNPALRKHIPNLHGAQARCLSYFFAKHSVRELGDNMLEWGRFLFSRLMELCTTLGSRWRKAVPFDTEKLVPVCHPSL